MQRTNTKVVTDSARLNRDPIKNSCTGNNPDNQSKVFLCTQYAAQPPIAIEQANAIRLFNGLRLKRYITREL